MSSAISLLVFGQVYFLGPVTNTPSITPNASLTVNPIIQQGQNQSETSHEVQRSDYTYVSGIGSYKVHTQGLTWAEARLICEAEGGYLAIINSVNEANAISQVFQNSGKIVNTSYEDDAFLGYHDLYREGEYVTIHGESLQKAGYNEWNSGQPNGSGNQNCGGMNKNGRLNDLWCRKPFAFICEM